MNIKYRHALDGWRWRYLANNNEILAWAQSYASKQGCLESIELLRDARFAKILEQDPHLPHRRPQHQRVIYVWRNVNGWHFRYEGINGKTLVWGESYSSRANCYNAVELVTKAYTATVSEEIDEDRANWERQQAALRFRSIFRA